ncbi:MAG: hypothetical protein PHQ76_04390 [Caldisericia bacterium]|nr:hypothetical protein [Caldisericia bacterium]
MEGIPILYANRDLQFEPETVEKLRYLNHKRGKTGIPMKQHFSEIVNEALEEFFKERFEKLNIELFVDMEAIQKAEKLEREKRENERAREERRLYQLATLRMMKRAYEKEIGAIKKEEKENGKKYEIPADYLRQIRIIKENARI